MTPLPAYIDPEAWCDYEAMRKRIKKPMTPRIIRQKLALLQKVKDAGHDVNAWIDAATNGHWLDFYQPKELEMTKVSAAPAQTSAYLEDLAAHSAEATAMPAERRAEVAAALQRAKASIRRVA